MTRLSAIVIMKRMLLRQNYRDIFEGVLGMTEEQFNTLHEKQVF